MNVLFITEDHSKKNFGITTVLSQLLNEFVLQGTEIHPVLFTTEAEVVSQHKNIPIEVMIPAKIGRIWKWHPSLLKRIESIIIDHHIDIVHVHGLWMAAQWAGLTVEGITGRILSALG